MVRGEVEGRMSRLLASLANNSTNSTVYLFPQVNPEGGMRASRSRGRGGAEERSKRMMISPLIILLKCKLDNNSLFVGESVLEVGWRLAMVRGEVEGRMSRLLASLATNSTNSTVYLFPKVNPQGLAEGRGGGGLKKEPREFSIWIITTYLLARSVLKVGWRLAMVRGEVEGRMSRLLASLATNSNSSPARLTCKEQFLIVSSLSKVFPPIQY